MGSRGKWTASGSPRISVSERGARPGQCAQRFGACLHGAGSLVREPIRRLDAGWFTNLSDRRCITSPKSAFGNRGIRVATAQESHLAAVVGDTYTGAEQSLLA